MYTKLLSIVCLSSLPFLFTLNGDFVFDDSEAIVKNKDVISTSWVDPFYHDFWGADIKSNLSHKSYRPLTILTYRLNYLLSNRTLSAYQFKITNLICHVVCCLLVWRVFQIILNDKDCVALAGQNEGTNKKCDQDGRSGKWWTDTAYLATLLFAVHPVHVEAVCGVVGRADLLAAMAYFLAFITYHQAVIHKYNNIKYLFSTVALAGISMLCKENGVTVLGFCLVYEIMTKLIIKRIETKSMKILRIDNLSVDLAFRMFIMLAGITALLYGRWNVMGATKPVFKPTDNPAAFGKTAVAKVATYNYIYTLNILLLIWPQWLCYDWSMGCIQILERLLEFRMIFVYMMYIYGLYLLDALLLNRKNKISTTRSSLLALSLMVIPFLPASNIFYPVGFVIAERILYIPSAGYCLLLVIGFQKLLLRKTLAVCKIGVFMFLLLVLLYAARSWQRSKDWQNEYNLFTSGLAVCPSNAKVHYNVAKAADAKHHTAWALAEYKEAIRLYPQYYQAMNNLANLLKNQKKYNEAEYYLKLAVQHREDFPAAWMNLGILLATTRRFNESELAYKKALSHRKKYPDCYYNLGNLYLEINQTEEAIESWFQAINDNPKHVLAWTNLMALMDNTGQIERALEVIPKVLAELPDAPSINFAVANMYGKKDRYTEAETHFIKAIQLFGKEVKAIHYANLGVLYHRWKKYTLAEEMYNNALKIDPTFMTARKNLLNLQQKLDK